MEEKKDMKEDIDYIREKIKSNRDLLINRVPENTLLAFYNIANKMDFCKDYGMALREIVKSHIELQELKKIMYEGKAIVVMKND